MFEMNVKWDNYVWIMTLLIVLIYLGVGIFLLTYTTSFWDRIALIIISMVVIPFCFMAPRKIRLEEKKLVLSKMVGEFRDDVEFQHVR